MPKKFITAEILRFRSEIESRSADFFFFSFSYLECLQHVVAYRRIFDELAEEIDVTELGEQNIAQSNAFSHLSRRREEKRSSAISNPLSFLSSDLLTFFYFEETRRVFFSFRLYMSATLCDSCTTTKIKVYFVIKKNESFFFSFFLVAFSFSSLRSETRSYLAVDVR